jgi:hypothetical protein
MKYRGFRRPRTHQELAVEVPTRAKRRSIPTAYDDLKRVFWRSWKRYRRSQWRAKLGWLLYLYSSSSGQWLDGPDNYGYHRTYQACDYMRSHQAEPGVTFGVCVPGGLPS